jgi:hypothetical protein
MLIESRCQNALQCIFDLELIYDGRAEFMFGLFAYSHTKNPDGLSAADSL